MHGWVSIEAEGVFPHPKLNQLLFEQHPDLFEDGDTANSFAVVWDADSTHGQRRGLSSETCRRLMFGELPLDAAMMVWIDGGTEIELAPPEPPGGDWLEPGAVGAPPSPRAWDCPSCTFRNGWGPRAEWDWYSECR